jgi:hypothetical protein
MLTGSRPHRRLAAMLPILALALVACGGDDSPDTAAATPSPTGLTVNSRVGLKNIGPVVVGMTIEQMARAAGVSLTRQPDFDQAIATSGCAFMSPGTIPGYVPPPNSGNKSPIAFMMRSEIAPGSADPTIKLARIDILGGDFETQQGIKVGSSEQEVQTAFGGSSPLPPRAFIGPPYRYLTATPRQEADRDFRLVFESDGAKVVTYRAGKLPEVDWKNGCADAPPVSSPPAVSPSPAVSPT